MLRIHTLPCLALPLLGVAQSWFGPEQVLYANQEDPKEFRAGDLDGDGDQDLACTFELDGEMIIFLNDGTGTQWQKQVIGGLGGPKGLDFSDVDGDGDPDILVADALNSEVVWYANDGAGAFSDPEYVAGVENAGLVCGVDVDGDGDNDVITYGSEAGAHLHRNLGGGDFVVPEVIAGPSFASKMMVADLDGDLDFDLVLDDPAQPLRWYRNTGGSFSFVAAMSVAPGSFGWDLADVDSDGDTDAVLSGGGDIYYMLNDGSGGFSFFNPSASLGIAYLIMVRDVDQDGDLDILGCRPWPFNDPQYTFFTYYENHGTGFGGYEWHEQGDLLVYALSSYRWLLADMDTDGDLDLATTAGPFASAGGDQIHWTGQDTSTAAELLAPGARIHMYFPWSVYHVGTADVEPDGIDEFIMGSNYHPWQELSVDDDNVPQLQDLTCPSPAGSNRQQFADLDQDGLVDVFFKAESIGALLFAPGLGNASFGPLITIHQATSIGEAILADQDGDGDIDIIYSGWDSLFVPDPHVVGLLRNTGNGTFEPPELMHSTPSVPNLHMDLDGAADVDGDGDKDALVRLTIPGDGAPEHRMLLIQDQGNAVFSADTLPPVFRSSRGYADMNGDGAEDLMLRTPDGLHVCSYSSGTWDTTGTLIDTLYMNEYRLVDMDEDGDIDVVGSGGRIHVAWNDGSGVYASIDILPVPDPLTWVNAYPADVDHDGLLDVVATNNSLGTRVSWYKGDFSSSVPASATASNPGPLLFPDPFTDQARIVLAAWQGRPVDVTVVNANGALVFQRQGVRDPDMVLTREALRPGLYTLKISDGSGVTHVERFVIQ